MYKYIFTRTYNGKIFGRTANSAIALLQSKNIKNVDLLESQAWNHCEKKYPVVIRRLASGWTLDEALIELEPIEKVSEEIMVEGDLTCPKLQR